MCFLYLQLAVVGQAYAGGYPAGSPLHSFTPQCGLVPPSADHKYCVNADGDVQHDWFLYADPTSKSLCAYSPQLGNIIIDQQSSVAFVNGKRDFLEGATDTGFLLQARLDLEQGELLGYGPPKMYYSFTDYVLKGPQDYDFLTCRHAYHKLGKID